MPEPARSAVSKVNLWEAALQGGEEGAAADIKIRDGESGEMVDVNQLRVPPLIGKSAREPDNPGQDHLTFDRNSLLGRSVAELITLTKSAKESKDPGARRQSILKIIEFLRYPNLTLRSAVQRVCAKLGAEALEALTLSLNDSDPEIAENSALVLGALQSHSTDHRARRESVKAIAALLASERPSVRLNAVTALRYIGGDGADDILLRLTREDDRVLRTHVFQQLAYARSEAAVGSIYGELIERCGGRLDRAAIPVELAFVLTPHWIAAHSDSSDIRVIALAFGYIDEAVYSLLARGCDPRPMGAVNLLLSRVGLATADLLAAVMDSPEPESFLERCERRKQHFRWGLFSDGYLSRLEACSVPLLDDEASRRDRALLFAALREDDLVNLESKAEALPFDREHRDQAPGSFFYLTTSGFERFRLHPAMDECRRILSAAGASEESRDALMPFMVFEKLATQTNPQRLKAEEGRLMFQGKWGAFGRMIKASDGKLTLSSEYETFVPDEARARISQASSKSLSAAIQVFSQIDHRLWRFGVLAPDAERTADHMLKELSRMERWGQLSSAARSALRMAAYHSCLGRGRDSRLQEMELLMGKWLSGEKSRRGRCPSIGIEIQNATLPPAQTFAWKAALESFGIDSPRRPDFRYLVEAAFPPAWSPACLAASFPWLLDLGFCADPVRGMALHITLSGDLGEEAKYLALGLFQCNPPAGDVKMDHDSWAKSLGAIMSKGFIYRKLPEHEEKLVAPCEKDPAPSVATELRVLQLASQAGERSVIEKLFTQAVFAAQNLGAAILADRSIRAGGDAGPGGEALSRIWRRYAMQIDGLYLDGEVHKTGLLQSDWRSSSGDHHDTGLVKEVEMVKALERYYRFEDSAPEEAARLRSKTCEALLRASYECSELLGDD